MLSAKSAFHGNEAYVSSRGAKWETKFKDTRTSELMRYLCPMFFYTITSPNKTDVVVDSYTDASKTANGQPVAYKYEQNIHSKHFWDAAALANISTVVARTDYYTTTNGGTHPQAGGGYQGIVSVANSALGGQLSVNTNTWDMALPLMQERWRFKNTSNRPFVIKIYEYTCKKDCKIANNKVKDLWHKALDRKQMSAGTYTNVENTLNIHGITGTKEVPLVKEDVGREPFGQELDEIWECTGKVRSIIVPGRQLFYTAGNKPGTRLTSAHWNTSQVEGHDALKGITKEYIIITHGCQVGDLGDNYTNPDEWLSNSYGSYACSIETAFQFAASRIMRSPKVQYYNGSTLQGYDPVTNLNDNGVGINNRKIHTDRQSRPANDQTANISATTFGANSFN